MAAIGAHQSLSSDLLFSRFLCLSPTTPAKHCSPFCVEPSSSSSSSSSLLSFFLSLFTPAMTNRRQFSRLCKTAAEQHHHSSQTGKSLTSPGGEETVTETLQRLRLTSGSPSISPSSSSSSSSLAAFHEDPALPDEVFSYGFFDSEVLAAMRHHSSQTRTAGPAAPPSWRTTQTIRPLPRLPPPLPRKERERKLRSLEDLARSTVSQNLHRYSKELFHFVPASLKEQIMKEAAQSGKLGDRVIGLFEDEALQIFVASRGSVTVEGFGTLAPRLSSERNRSRDWEELLQEDDEIRIRGCPSLEAIDLSFCPRLEGIGFSQLLAEHWKNLKVLVLAGCFSIKDGPTALRTIGATLEQLELLDISECFWVTTRLVADLPWETQLGKLQLLNLTGCRQVENPVEPRIRKLANRTTLRILQ